MNKIIVYILSISILIITTIMYVTFIWKGDYVKNIWMGDGTNNLQPEIELVQSGNMLYVHGFLWSTGQKVSHIDYQQEGNDIFVWFYKKPSFLVYNSNIKQSIQLDKKGKYRVLYKNLSNEPMFVKDIDYE